MKKLLGRLTSLGLCQKTWKRWRANPMGDRRKGPLSRPANRLSETEEAEILAMVNSQEYRDKSPCQIVPMLADRGVFLASESTIYRILRRKKMLAHRGKAKPRQHKKPVPLVATKPGQVYSWDITYLPTCIRGQFLYLYLFLDVFSRKIVGFHVSKNQSEAISSQLISEICVRENIKPHDLTLHSDNGGPMKGSTMLATLRRLGVTASFSRPRVSDDNPFSESLFRSLKYCPLYPESPFADENAATAWMQRFADWYNNEHHHSGIKFVTPASRHLGTDEAILIARKRVYAEAKKLNPNRWSGDTRNWDRVASVSLNHLPKREVIGTSKAA